jgi:threonine/homoserine/homoserine lactone efflux protein
MMHTFFQGFLVSIIATFPIGVVSAIAVARTLRGSYRDGFFTLLGSSFADLLAFFIILSGISFSFTKNPDVRLVLSLVASIVTILIGVSVIRNKNKIEQKIQDDDIEEETGNFLSGFFVTILNPYQFIAYSIFLTSLNIHYYSKVLIRTFSFGAFLGSFIWAIVVPLLIVKLKEGYTKKVGRVYPYIGYVILLVGSSLFFRAFYLFFK